MVYTKKFSVVRVEQSHKKDVMSLHITIIITCIIDEKDGGSWEIGLDSKSHRNHTPRVYLTELKGLVYKHNTGKAQMPRYHHKSVSLRI